MACRIVLADDHAIVRAAVRSLLEQNGLVVVGQASNGREAVNLCGELHPDIAILDLAMPVLNGLRAATEIIRTSPETKTVLLTVHREDHYVREALRTGIKAYVWKSRAADALVQAIEEVLRGNVYLSPGLSQHLLEDFLARERIRAHTSAMGR